jgi:hypothetical protein
VDLVELIHLVLDLLAVQILEMEEVAVTVVFLLEDQVDQV